MSVVTLSVPTIVSEGCLEAIDERLRKVPGVEEVAGDLATKTVRVTGVADPAAIEDAIAAIGHTVG